MDDVVEQVGDCLLCYWEMFGSYGYDGFVGCCCVQFICFLVVKVLDYVWGILWLVFGFQVILEQVQYELVMYDIDEWVFVCQFEDVVVEFVVVVDVGKYQIGCLQLFFFYCIVWYEYYWIGQWGIECGVVGFGVVDCYIVVQCVQFGDDMVVEMCDC